MSTMNRKQRRSLKKDKGKRDAINYLHTTIELFMDSAGTILSEIPDDIEDYEAKVREKYLYAAGQVDIQIKFMPPEHIPHIREFYFEEMFIQSFYGVKEKNPKMPYIEVVDMVFDHYKFTRKDKNRPYIKPKGPGTGKMAKEKKSD